MEGVSAEEQRPQLALNLLVGCFGCRRPRGYHDVEASSDWQRPEGLMQAALDSISHDGRPNAARCRDCEAGNRNR
jgi:hypothetical protein